MNNTRDLIGYGQQGCDISWPNNARIAINFIINYESGAERSPLYGDKESESYLTDIPSANSYLEDRNLSCESTFEYGSRCGIWRLHRLFQQYNIPLTIFACGQALEKNPEYCNFLATSPHEVAGHGYRWIDHRQITLEEERQHIKKTLAIISEKTKKSVYGYYTGRKSKFTLELLSEENLLYHSESYADDLPFWQRDSTNKQLVIPYNLVTNDFRYATSPGFTCSQQFYNELKDAFDYQYHEGEHRPQLLTIGLHDRLSGRPS